MQVALNHTVSRRTDIFQAASQENSLALRKTLRLDNESPCFALRFALEVGLKFMIFHWQHPGQRKEVIVVRKALSHTHESAAQQVLTG